MLLQSYTLPLKEKEIFLKYWSNLKGWNYMCILKFKSSRVNKSGKLTYVIKKHSNVKIVIRKSWEMLKNTYSV